MLGSRNNFNKKNRKKAVSASKRVNEKLNELLDTDMENALRSLITLTRNNGIRLHIVYYGEFDVSYNIFLAEDNMIVDFKCNLHPLIEGEIYKLLTPPETKQKLKDFMQMKAFERMIS